MLRKIICWPLNVGKSHIKNTLATEKRWPRPLNRGGRWIEVSNTAVYWQINRDFGKWSLNGGWPLNRWPLSRGRAVVQTQFLIPHSLFSIPHSPLPIAHSPLPIAHSSFSILHSPFTIPHFLFPIPHSLFAISHSHSRFPIQNSPFLVLVASNVRWRFSYVNVKRLWITDFVLDRICPQANSE